MEEPRAAADRAQHRQPQYPATRSDRIFYAVVALFLIAVLVVARLLTPDSSGVGTHEQLGLPPCTFHLATGHGCPGCGLTTAFAHIARGDLEAALAANPAGLLIFGLVLLCLPFAVYRTLRPTPIHAIVESPWTALFFVLLSALMTVIWIVRLIAGAV